MVSQNERKDIKDTQWQINTNKELIASLKYQLEMYQDFWEWYEEEYQVSAKELWEEFEKWFDEKENKMSNVSNF